MQLDANSSSQYLSDDFQALLKQHGITCRMSDTCHCYDGALFLTMTT